ncbi:hypothetical protein DEU56DRAFT_798404 [Suillus clintonianus]|uniref:uncharacterized protein n=1 Tax=Suillus clintonianus TaxID=1904413 RepID=UPI001B87038E|nr:uncharacterized protein DEU56DRAFT_798404 [Suillus clintonianus]KAG2140070.1 hypothetical protein DEU56DRAFT_798404 [Suillus clintonianus]
MSGQWESIIFDDPRSRHPMLPLVVKVMHCIYVTVDPTRPPPPTVMKWWHSQSLSYQVHDHEYEPSIVILNLREGKRDSTMKTHFTINFNTMTVNDVSLNRRFPVPNEIHSVVRDLDEYVRKTVREKKEAEAEEARRCEKEREEHRSRVQAFCRCLIDKGLIDEDHAKLFSSDSLQCPVCSAQQTSCTRCKSISCSNNDCVASSAVPIVRCCMATHPSHTRQFCTSCLEPPGSLPRLGKCPMCSNLFCTGELSWCVGRPNSNDGVVGIATSSDIDVPGITRVHSARPLYCHNTGCIQNSQDGGRVGRRCSNTDCWSFRMYSTNVCPECITQDSFSCPCGQYWTCGSCKSQSSDIRRLLTCPRCHQCFCESCSYIWTCGLCRRVGFCSDCMEEESEEVEHAPGVNLLFKCQNCQGHLCNACDDGGQPCCTCSRMLCNLCAKDEECERCAHFRQRCNYDYGFFEFGSDDEMTYHDF